MYAGLGIGLLFTYRASGVLNLAHGALAMYPAYVYAELRTSGNLVLPGIPGTLHVGIDGRISALAVALAAACLIGLLAEVIVFGPLRRRAAPPLACVVATVGVLLFVQAVVTLRFDAASRNVSPLLPQSAFRVGTVVVPADGLYLSAIVAAVAVASWWVQSRTRFGLASRAVAENEAATALLGYSPGRLGIANWVIGSGLAGLFGVLVAPLTGLSPSTYVFLVVPALAAGLASGFTSVAVTVGVGVVLGVAQSELARVHLALAWLGPEVTRQVLPFVLLVAVVALRGTPLPRRGALSPLRFPRADAPRHRHRPVVVLIGVGLFALTVTSGATRSAVIVSMIGAIVCLSLVVLTGFAGQISLAQMSFAGIGAFTLSRLSTDLHIPFPFAPLIAASCASACGVIVGLPAVRARGVSFAVVTLGGALAVEELVFRNLSRGVLATDAVPPPHLGALDLGPTSAHGQARVAFGCFVLAVLASVAFGVLRLRRSTLGRNMLAVRANERAAAAGGVDVTRTKLAAFAISAFVAGVAGVLMGYHQGVVSGQSFGLDSSLVALAAAYIGGIGSVGGALLGGLGVVGGAMPHVAEAALHLGRYQFLFGAVGMTSVAIRNPEGIAAVIRDRRPGVRRQ